MKKRDAGKPIVFVMAVVAVAFVVAVLVGHNSSAPMKAQEKSRYLALVTPYDAANTALLRRASAGDNITVAQFKAACVPLINAAVTFDKSVLRIGLTGKAATDAHALVSVSEAFIAALRNLTAANIQAELPVLEHDNAAATSAGNHLRADLGLPPVATGG